MSSVLRKQYRTIFAGAPIMTISATNVLEMSRPKPTLGLFDSLRENRLQWIAELGIGYFPVTAQPYNAEYWENYRRLDKSPSGDALTGIRIDLVAKHWVGAVTDIGIGGGRFVTERPQTFGYDVNPVAVAWLHEHGRFQDPHKEEVDAVTLWDALEHIHDPRPLLANVRKLVFVSIPIFKGLSDVLRSKHLKPKEHVWYFERCGLNTFMELAGFVPIDWNRMETEAGREQIETFVFRRE
jgi:hypothetical protein